ncbi:hypothetical protein JCM11641_007356 [Rhodosporidiobolus odoratus]
MAAPTDSNHLEAYKAQAMREFQAAQSYLNTKREDVHTRIVEPAVAFFVAAAQSRPLATTFLSIFAALSFLPLVTFSLFAAGSVLVVGGGALIAAAIVISWLVGSAALILAGTLAVTAVISAFATVWLLAAYAAYRFFSIVGKADTLPDAIKEFQHEASNLYVGTAKQIVDETGGDHTFVGGKKVRINGVVQQEGDKDVLVKADGVST